MVLRERGSVEEIYPYWLQTKMSKEFDGMPWFARGNLDFLIRELYPKNSELVLNSFYEYGIKLGNYLKIKTKNIEELSKFFQVIRISIPARVFELEPFEDASGKGYVMRYVSGISQEMTTCMAKYLQGIFSCFSTNTQSRMASGGMVELEIRVT